MSDNTPIATGTGSGDTIRDIQRTQQQSTAGVAATAKTEVVQLDFGGPNTSPERLASSVTPIPNTDPYTVLAAQLALQSLLLAQAAQIGGYVPLDPSIGGILGIEQ